MKIISIILLILIAAILVESAALRSKSRILLSNVEYMVSSELLEGEAGSKHRVSDAIKLSTSVVYGGYDLIFKISNLCVLLCLALLAWGRIMVLRQWIFEAFRK